MRHAKSTLLLIVLTSILAGCEGHQAKVNRLQREYEKLGNQFQQDCSAEYLKMPPNLSPKCADEKKKQEDLWNQLQVERARR